MSQTRLTVDEESAFRDGQQNALRILEEHFVDLEKRGKRFWTSEQLIQVVRSTRLNLEDIFS